MLINHADAVRQALCCQPEVTACIAVAQHALCVRIVHAWIPPQVVTSSLGPLLRFGTGALASGYKAEFVPDDASSSGTYTLATVGGRRIKETSAVRQHLSVTQQGSAWPGYRGCWLGGRGGCTIVSILSPCMKETFGLWRQQQGNSRAAGLSS